MPNRTVVTSFASAAISTASNDGTYEEGHYVLHVANNGSSLLSCALSNQCVLTYDRETMKKVHSIERAHTNGQITDLCHSQVNSSSSAIPLVVTSGQDGLVKLFDLRTNGGSNGTSSALHLHLPDKTEALSVSIGYQGALAAVGGSKGHIHFFDLRNLSSSSQHVTTPMGAYVDAHTEEVTRVRFQNVVGSDILNDTTSLLVSSSEDGLACIHDTSQASEEEALKSIMNVQSPLRDVNFFGPALEGLYCLTGSETMSVWHHDSAQRICDFGDVRSTLSNNAGVEINYLVGCHWDGNELNLMAGNTEGDCAIFRVDANSIAVKATLKGGHKASIRSFAVSSRTNTAIVTGGEDSRLCEWCLDDKKSELNQFLNKKTNKGLNIVSPSTSGGAILQNVGGGRIKRSKNKKGHANSPY